MGDVDVLWVEVGGEWGEFLWANGEGWWGFASGSFPVLYVLSRYALDFDHGVWLSAEVLEGVG